MAVDPTPASRPDEEIIRGRQKSGSRVTAMLLFGFVVLVFAITIAKLTLKP